jgi:hypothetical protein
MQLHLGDSLSLVEARKLGYDPGDELTKRRAGGCAFAVAGPVGMDR